MKIADFISQSIQEYRSLYKSFNYEESKLKVLNHIFFTTGNGLELAETKNKKEGGYLTYPTYKKNKKGDWIIDIDKPYGEETYKPIPDDYFDSVIYYISHTRKLIETFKIDDDYSVYFRFNKEIKDEFMKPKLLIAENTLPFNPSCTPFSNILFNEIFLQEDWLKELILLCETTLNYFNNESQYKNNFYYSTEKKINLELELFKTEFEEKGINGIIKLRKIWGYELKETIPDYTEIEIKKTNSWINYRQGQIETLTSIINSKK